MMKYTSKPETVEAFKFTEQSEITAPQWFGRLIDEKKAYIDRVLIDGAVKVRGCTIYADKSTLKAKNGDYVIRWPGGTISVESTKRFKRHFTREDGNDGN